jgi:hypothetical protein
LRRPNCTAPELFASPSLFVSTGENDMTTELDDVSLSNGVLVRHRVSGYMGRIDGVTAMQGCFTDSGAPKAATATKESFQYRIMVKGEKLRRIAPRRDLEVLDAATKVDVTCVNCQATFSGTTSVNDQPGGLCECGGWVCPECLRCQASTHKPADEGSGGNCPNERKRLLKKTTGHKQTKGPKVKLLSS